MFGWGEHSGEIVMGLACIAIPIAFVTTLIRMLAKPAAPRGSRQGSGGEAQQQ
jgi:hypothetical protein